MLDWLIEEEAQLDEQFDWKYMRVDADGRGNFLHYICNIDIS